MEALCNATSQTPWVVTRPAEGSMFQKKCLHVSLVFLHPSPKSQAPERNKRTVVISGVQFCSILNRQGTVASITLQFRHARPQRGAQVGEMQNQQFTLYTQLATKPLSLFQSSASPKHTARRPARRDSPVHDGREDLHRRWAWRHGYKSKSSGKTRSSLNQLQQ